MDRRIFLKSLCGLAGATAAVVVFAPAAQALPLLDDLKAMDAKGANPLLKEASLGDADLPSAGANEAQYYYGPRRRWRRHAYGRPVYRPWRRRCRTFINRRGRLVRRCG